MKNLMKLCAILGMLQVSSLAAAADISWTDGNGNQDWFDADNWDDGSGNPGVPTNADTAHVNAGLTADVNASATVGRVVLENDAIINIDAGGDLDVVAGFGQPGQILQGNNSTSASDLNVDGSLTVAAEFAIGNNQGSGTMTVGATGVVNANGPWLIGGHLAGADGTINVNGGTINATVAQMALGWNGTGTLNVNGGLVDVTGVMNLGVNNAASNGDIVINAGEVISAGLNIGNNLGSGSLLMEDGAKYTNNGGFVQSIGSTVTINGSAEFEFTLSTLEDVEALVLGSPDWIFSGTPSVTGILGSVIVTNFVDLPGDFDGDGDVDGNDFLKWQVDALSATELDDWEMNFGTGVSVASVAVAVPEPSSILLLGVLGLIPVFASRRRAATFFG